MTNEVKVIAGIGILAVLVLVGIVIFGSSSVPPRIEAKKVDKGELVRDYSQRLGNPEAKVTIVEFADFQCPACGAAYPNVKQLMTEYQDRVQLVHRNFPLSSHANADIAARAAEAAGKLGKFWEMYGQLFENQTNWSASLKPEVQFTNYAKAIGLDEKEFKDALNDSTVVDRIATDKGDTEALGLTSTPTFFINGEKYTGDYSYEALKMKVETYLMTAPR